MDVRRLKYETKAAVVIARHGGVIERTIIEEPSEPAKPIREVHVVTFPDLEAFELKRAVEIYGPARKIFDLIGARSDFRVERAVSAADILEKYRELVLAPLR